MSHSIRTSLVLLALLASGCGAYRYNRCDDLRDCLSAYAGRGAVLPIVVGVDLTPVLPLGIGIATGADGHAIGYGVHGRSTGRFRLAVIDLPFNFLFLDGYPDHPFPPAGSVFLDTPTAGWNQHRWGRIGGHFGILRFHTGAHLELVEIADFLLGCATLDLCSDDCGFPCARWKQENGTGNGNGD